MKELDNYMKECNLVFTDTINRLDFCRVDFDIDKVEVNYDDSISLLHLVSSFNKLYLSFKKEYEELEKLNLGKSIEVASFKRYDYSNDNYRVLTVYIDKPTITKHGDTVLYGYNYALENKASFIFQTDSDGQTLPEEFWPFWEERNDHAAIIGYRKGRQDGLSRKFVTKTLKFVLFCVFHCWITDANTPFRLMKNSTLKKYYPRIPEHFNLSNVMLTVLMIDAKEDVEFKEITFRPRQGGVNSINFRKITKIGIQAVKDFRRIKKEMKRTKNEK